jgi:hypothetical protein
MTLRFYRIDSLYRVLVFLNQAIIVVSLCVGTILLVHEIRRGRFRNAL